jgi:xanthine dehydrogenase accessory factor
MIPDLTASDLLLAGPSQSDWPLHGLVDDVRPALAALLDAGVPGALATLVAVDGPSPRPLGSQMLIALDGRAVGYVSGGCVEGSLAIIGQEVAVSGQVRQVVFGSGSPFVDVQLVCGSRIEVLIEPVSPGDQTLIEVIAAWRRRQPIARQVDKQGRAQIRPLDASAASAGVTTDGQVWKRYDPQVRIMVFGRDPVALAISQLALTMGLEAVLVRRLGPEAAPAGFATAYRSQSPGSALADLVPDRWTALITTTHDLDEDHETLLAALPSEAFYVGALGSRRRVADRLQKLEMAGLDWRSIRRLNAPVGLDIGASSPREIALSVLSDIVRHRRDVESA